MPVRGRSHYQPAPLSECKERMLLRHWQTHHKDKGVQLKELVSKLNEKFGTKMQGWQLIRWRSPSTVKDAERNILLEYVEFIAADFGMYEIFRANGVSVDDKLTESKATIWYHPRDLLKPAIKRIVTEQMVHQVDKPQQAIKVLNSFVSIYELVANYLDIILEAHEIEYDKKALTPKIKRQIATDIYSIVGFDFHEVS